MSQVPPFDADTSSRDRILQSAKALFAQRGYEGTTTVAIARAASTSESQMMKHFGSKEGILEAIFEEGWEELARRVPVAMEGGSEPAERLQILVRTLMGVFEGDPDLRSLMLLEGRRIRKGEQAILLTRGYRGFIELLDRLLREMRAAGQLRDDLPIEAVRSALIGAFESLQRDRLLQERAGFPAHYGAAEIGAVFAAVMSAFVIDPDA